MILRIELAEGVSETVLMLIGRIDSAGVQQLQARIADARNLVALDLQQVCLVDLDAVRFLTTADRAGIELRHLPRYVREWMLVERQWLGERE